MIDEAVSRKMSQILVQLTASITSCLAAIGFVFSLAADEFLGKANLLPRTHLWIELFAATASIIFYSNCSGGHSSST